MRRYLICAVAALMLTSMLAVQPADAAARVRIDKIYYGSPGTDTGSNSSLNGEWIRLKNFGTTKINIRGWTIRDSASHVYRFGKRILKPGKVVYLHTGGGDNTTVHRYWGEDNYVWNNTGDRATLKNANGSVVDRCRYSGGGSAATC